jgi:hypothetical protein
MAMNCSCCHGYNLVKRQAPGGQWYWVCADCHCIVKDAKGKPGKSMDVDLMDVDLIDGQEANRLFNGKGLAWLRANANELDGVKIGGRWRYSRRAIFRMIGINDWYKSRKA